MEIEINCPDCPIETTLILLNNKWKFLIIRDLLNAPHRFSELRKSIPMISQKVLTKNLRELEESGLLIRTVYPEIPLKVEYSLTELGASLKPVLNSLAKWGKEYKATLFC